MSDPWFSNLYLFRRVHDYRVRPGPYACVSGRTYDGARHLLPLFELNEASDAVLRGLLIDHRCFYPLSESQVQRLDANRFEWFSSRDDADYLYSADCFRDYRGRSLKEKRQLVMRLLATHEVQSEPYKEVSAPLALEVVRGWMAAKGKSQGEADEEECVEALGLSSRLGLTGFIYRVDGALAGFILAQRIQPGVFVMRFANGLDRFKGIYQYMFQHFCAVTPTAMWLNFEQDMGLPNLRRTKLSYHPLALVPKYRVALRSL